jgi:NADH-quinone oxidoreductase subunit C
VPDATGLELIAHELREKDADAVLDTVYFRDKAALEIAPGAIRATLLALREKGFDFLASVHGVDYYPQEPRLGVHYELLDMTALDRLTVKLRVSTDDPRVPSVTPDWPTADHQEREVYDMFGVIFEGHPDLRRILMPEDYEGFPQRRDFPIGGEPVLFTVNEAEGTDYTIGADSDADKKMP